MAADGRPAAGHGVAACALKDGVRMVKAVERTQEAVAVGVKALDGRVDGVDGVVVAALAVFGLVVDGAALDLHFARGEVALEVGGIVLRVPQAELHEAEQGNLLVPRRAVFQFNLRDQRVCAARDHARLRDGEAVLFRRQLRVAKAVAALVVVKRRFDRHIARGKDGVPVLDVEVLAARVGGHVVVAVAGDAQHTRVLIEAVSAAGIAHQGKEGLAAQVVDPGRGRVRTDDDVLAGCVVKVTVSHEKTSLLLTWSTPVEGSLLRELARQSRD